MTIPFTKTLSNMFAMLVVFSTSAVWAPAALADDDDDRGPFTERTIRGAWGWTGDGKLIINPETGQTMHTVGLGIVYFDGYGRCEVTSSVNINGTPQGPITSTSCVYSVNPDGTGQSVATFSEPPFEGDAPVTFVIVNKRKEIRFIQNNQFVVTFVAKRI